MAADIRGIMVLDVSRPATVRRLLNWTNLFWAPVSLAALILTLFAGAMALFPMLYHDDSVSSGIRVASAVAFALMAVAGFGMWIWISRLHPRAYAVAGAAVILWGVIGALNAEFKYGEYRSEVGELWLGLQASLQLVATRWRLELIWSPWTVNQSASEVIAIGITYIGAIWLVAELARSRNSKLTLAALRFTTAVAIVWTVVALLRIATSPNESLTDALKAATSVFFSNSHGDEAPEVAIARILSPVREQLGAGLTELVSILSPVFGLLAQGVGLWVLILLLSAVIRYPIYLWSFSSAQWNTCKFPVPKRFLPTLQHALGMAPISYLSATGTPLPTIVFALAKILIGVGAVAAQVLFGFTSWLISWERPADIAPLWRNAEASAEIFYGVAATAAALVAGVVLAQLARELAPRGYLAARARDPRPPALFLRSFAQDRGEVGLDAPHPELPANLEALLLNIAGAYGPVIALGSPNDRSVRSGVGREYVDSQHWQQRVMELTQEAASIVAFVDSTPGIRWEIELLLRRDLRSKSLFLLNPQLARKAAADIRNNSVLARSPALRGRMPIGVFHSDEGTILIVSGNTKIGDYHCALSAFLLYLFGHPSGAVARPKL